MQDLIRAQSIRDNSLEENGIVNITIFDDNSSSNLDYEDLGDEDPENDLMIRTGNLSFDDTEKQSISDHYISPRHVCRKSHELLPSSTGELNRIMLKNFKKRQRYLRERMSLTPKQLSSKAPIPATLPFEFSPSKISTQRFPHLVSNDDFVDHSRFSRNSQRVRMSRLRSGLEEKMNAPPPLS